MAIPDVCAKPFYGGIYWGSRSAPRPTRAANAFQNPEGIPYLPWFGIGVKLS